MVNWASAFGLSNNKWHGERSHYSCIWADLLAQADRLGPNVGGHLALLATFVRWTGWTLAVAVQCYDDSTINIVVAIIIIIILFAVLLLQLAPSLPLPPADIYLWTDWFDDCKWWWWGWLCHRCSRCSTCGWGWPWSVRAQGGGNSMSGWTTGNTWSTGLQHLPGHQSPHRLTVTDPLPFPGSCSSVRLHVLFHLDQSFSHQYITSSGCPMDPGTRGSRRQCGSWATGRAQEHTNTINCHYELYHYCLCNSNIGSECSQEMDRPIFYSSRDPHGADPIIDYSK